MTAHDALLERRLVRLDTGHVGHQLDHSPHGLAPPVGAGRTAPALGDRLRGTTVARPRTIARVLGSLVDEVDGRRTCVRGVFRRLPGGAAA